MGVAVCRHRGGDVAATDVDFVFVLLFIFVFVFVAPRQWGRGVRPLPSREYWCYGLVCRRGHCPWCRRPTSGDKDGVNDNDRGDNK
jgi:hypothetical protein